ncbi:MAG: hypothetical protein J6B11_09725 [Spirochaetales bacterium]|nr:hypothetical protein [Spirochaetales bacterium]
MDIVTLLFYPLLCICILPVILALTNHDERVGFLHYCFFSILISFAWIFLFGRLEKIPYNHIEWYQVFFYYLLLDYQGLLGIVICTAAVLLLHFNGRKMPVWLRTGAILFGINTVFSISQILRTEIPNNIFELLTPLALNILIWLLINLSASFIKERKQWWILGVSTIGVCLCNGLFNSLLFFYKPLHCLSILIAAIALFVILKISKRNIIKIQ